MNTLSLSASPKAVLAGLLACWLLLAIPSLQAREYQGYQYRDRILTVATDDGSLQLSFRNENAIEVTFVPEGEESQPAFLLERGRVPIEAEVEDRPGQLHFKAEGLRAVIRKTPVNIEFYREGELVVSEAGGFFAGESARGVRFRLSPEEKLLGGGERVMEADRRGYRLPLYNAPDGEYTTYSERMNYRLPGVLSSS